MLPSTIFLRLLLITSLDVVTGARILAILPTPVQSHHIWNRALMLQLASRGHQVTVLSPETETVPVPNHRDILMEGMYEHARSLRNYTAMHANSALETIRTMFGWGDKMCEYGMETKGVQSLMKMKNETFDLIIVEITFYECFWGFVHHFGYPPVIAITAFSSPPWASYITGNPETPSYVPNIFLSYSNHMSLYERTVNTFIHTTLMWYRRWVYIPRIDKIASKYFGDKLPSVGELERHISLIMTNTHFSMDYPQPLVPAMIPVGGMHITPPKPLPQDLQEYLDDAKDGVIFFSLGSNVRSDELSSDKINAFLDAFKQFPQRILWKWESDTLQGKPENVKLGKWLPQNDILAHPNVRLFITHAGLLSTQEAVYHGVPIVGIPFFADQPLNVGKIVAHGTGVKLLYSQINTETVLEAIRTVIYNASYRENMKRLSAQFRDQPQSPLDRAVFWTEYVIRHKGAPHLRSAALDITWYQYLLLDVIGLFLLAVALGLAVVWITIKSNCWLCRQLERPFVTKTKIK